MMQSEEILRIPRNDKNWITTYTGRRFWPLDPRPEEIDIADVAHHLSQMCRWTGATTPFYSVAEHAVRVSRLAELEAKRLGRSTAEQMISAMWGLHHDDSEAYLHDLSAPMKSDIRFSSRYLKFEAGLMYAVAVAFRLPRKIPSLVHWADLVLRETERRDLMRGAFDPDVARAQPLPEKMVPWGMEIAAGDFLQRHVYLSERIAK